MNVLLGKLPAEVVHAVLMLVVALLGWAVSSVPNLGFPAPLPALIGAALTYLIAFLTPAVSAFGLGKGAADADLGEPVHRTENRDRLAQAGFHDADGDADQRLGRGPAAEHIHVEVQADAQIARDHWGKCGVTALIGQHPIDFGVL